MWILYSTLGCHLCERAQALIDVVLGSDVALDIVDISEDDDLMASYGVRIPVIKNRITRSELAWPFTERELSAWVREQSPLE